jgi:putative ABC transport system permease protein
MGPLPLDWLQLVAAASLIVVAIACARVFRLGLELDFAWATARTVAQLLLVGYVLLWIFEQDAAVYVALAFAVMLGTATWTASRRVERPVPGLLASSGIALAIGCGATTLAVTAFIVRADPWWSPRYLLPLAGMIVGNSMNAAALTAERLQSEIALREREIEELLSLAATPRQAVAPALRAAILA